MNISVLVTAVLLTGLGSNLARAEVECSVPIADWQPRNVVQQMAKEKGWTVQRLKTDDGCYVLKGHDQKGRDIYVRIDPATLEILDISPHADDDEADEVGEEKPAPVEQ